MGFIFQDMCLKLKRAGSNTAKNLAEGGTVIASNELFSRVFFFCKTGVPQRLIYGQFFCQGLEDMKQSIEGNYQRG